MIVDSSELNDAQLANVDVCIIGAGAAGLTLACELDGTGLNVVLLEAGGVAHEPGLADYYTGTAAPPHPGLTEFRRLGLGGTTSLWGGRCIPLDPIDFERRDYVAHSGWPIGYDEVGRYYPRAMQYCDAGACDFTVAGSLKNPTPTVAGFDGRAVMFTDRIERYSLPTDFGRRYRRRIERSGNVTLVLHARCTRLRKRAGSQALESVELVDRAARVRRVQPRFAVLATGGIEVPRLLLNSDPDGALFGNGSDLVGRYYMCHFESTCGRLVANGAPVSFDFEKTRDGVYCRRRLGFAPATQREHRLLNGVYRLHFPDYSDPAHGSAVMSAIYLARATLPAEYRAVLRHNRHLGEGAALRPHLVNVARGLPQLARFAKDWLLKRQLARRKLPYTLIKNADGSFPIEFNSEQEPTPTNRIALLPESDRHGVRRVAVSWSIGAQEVEAACRSFILFRDTLQAGSSVSRLEFDAAQLAEQIRRAPPLGGHHIGTARMGATERQGVVGPDCSVFGVNNLFIASSAVFPTSGAANPTLTIVALALRLADHLKLMANPAA
jgi:choline dehydrogenase-like flavoprotein